MADQNPDGAEQATEEAQPKKSKVAPILVMLVMAAGGYFAGTSFLAPKILSAGGDEPADAHAEPEPEEAGGHGAPADDGHGAPANDGHGAPANDGHGAPANDGHGAPADDGHGGGSDDDGHFMEIGNVLVNPRDSRGLRFLMASIALEVDDSDTRTMLLQREAQVRDVVISVLEQKTLEELSTPGIRDSLRIDLRQAVIDEFHMPFLNVFISQFVIN